MKHVILTVAGLLVAMGSSLAQKVVLENERTETPTFLSVQGRSVKKENADATLRQVLAMRASDDLVPVQQFTDELGMTHTRYQQYYQGIKVEYNTYMVHTRDGYVTAMNGEFERVPTLNITPALSESAAFSAALSSVNAKTYAWESAEGRAAYAEAMGHQPEQGELVIVNDWNSANGEHMAPRLAYKFTIHSEDPFAIDYVFIDAQNGKMLLRNPDVHHVAWTEAEHAHEEAAVDLRNTNWAPLAATSVPTRYSGTQTVGTQNTGSSYRLYDDSRAAYVHTKNANTSSSWSFSSASELTDSDNNWSGSTAYSTGGLDAQWASGLTYDYFAAAHGRAGIDDNNMPMRNLVNANSNWFNAQWSSSYNTMRYGMGSDGNSPLTTLDVGAHELVHGITSSSSNLVYSYESGALNEGMSDCFAAAVEITYASGKQSWKIGEELAGGYIRSMDNPNEKNHPDTYGGTYYYTGSGDNGGVHYNSAILNHFFYILVEGKTGTNDNGDAFSVTGIGLADAAAILYRVNNVYLTSSSNFAAARTATISAATDLFGASSDQLIQATNAWYAVGVGAAHSGGGGGGGGTGCYDDANATAVPYAESFESGSGVWNQASCDDIDWTRDASGTPSSSTGPSSGSAGSYYMYVEASNPNYPGKSSDIFAAFDLSGSTSPELTFDYHSYGTVTDVSLKVEASTDGTNFTTLWSMTGNQGNQWNSVTVDLSAYAGGDVTLRFAAVTGSGWQGDVAIDNLAIGEASGGGGGGGSTNNCGSAADLSGSTGNMAQYTWTVDAGTQELVVSISGGTGDADLYVRQAGAPTTSSYDCRPYLSGNNETCTFQNPTPGTWYIAVRAYSSYSGVLLEACNNGVPALNGIGGEEAEMAFDSEVAGGNSFQVFPNPATDVLNIATAFELNPATTARVMTISGQVALEVPAAQLRDGIDVSGLTNGMYIISVEDVRGNLRTEKFIKE